MSDFFQNDANSFNSYSRFLIGVYKISLVKKLTFWQHKVELEILQKLQFYPSAPLLMIKKSQSAGEKLDSYCKKYSSGVLEILITDLHDMVLVQFSSSTNRLLTLFPI